MKNIFFLLPFLLLLRGECISQAKPSRFFLSTGYGLGGSLFSTSYDEATPSDSLGYSAFLNKKFIGAAQEIAVGVHLKRNVDIKLGYNRQRFTRHVHVEDTLRGVGLILDHRIQDVDNNWFIGMDKNYIKKSFQLFWGAGLYLLSSQQHTVEIYPAYLIDRENVMKGSYNAELGAYAEFDYEYKFQPKVNIGVKGQFFWIVSGSYPESVALFPFIELNF